MRIFLAFELATWTRHSTAALIVGCAWLKQRKKEKRGPHGACKSHKPFEDFAPQYIHPIKSHCVQKTIKGQEKHLKNKTML